jgi:hypothetical protein
MKLLPSPASRTHRRRGYSLVELVYVSAMSVSVFGAAVLAFRAISVQQTRSTNYGRVTVGATNLQNFYGLRSTSTFNTWFAPNYGRSIRAEEMRELFHSDVETASAVFGLPRAGRSSVRPTAVALPASTPGLQVDTPAAFLSVLASSEPDAGTIFSSYRGLPPTGANNGSFFIVQPSLNTEPNQLTVRCVWEIDLVPIVGTTTTPGGTYASVRRYVGTTLTHYYDTFYKDDASGFGPALVHFERAARASGGPSATATGEAFKRAAGQSFYFMWWPDPGAPNLRPSGGAAPTDLNGSTISTGDFRNGYAAHYGQTSLFFVVPMFPCAQ